MFLLYPQTIPTNHTTKTISQRVREEREEGRERRRGETHQKAAVTAPSLLRERKMKEEVVGGGDKEIISHRTGLP